MSAQNNHKRNFFTDYWRKIAALFLAFATWLLISSQIGKPSQIANVKIKFFCSNPKIVLPEKTEEVIVNITTFRQTEVFSKEDFEIEVHIPENLQAEGVFRYSFDLIPSMVTKQPFFTDVVSFSPPTVNISMDVIKEKVVPIRVHQIGELSYDRTTQIKMEPESVILTGPSESLKGIKYIFTEDLNLNSISNNFETKILLKSPAPDITMNATETKLHVQIVNSREETVKTYKDIPIRILDSLPGKWTIIDPKPMTATISIKGSRKQLDTIQNMDIYPFIDLGEASEPGVFHAKIHIPSLPYQNLQQTMEPGFLELKIEQNQQNQPQADK